MGPQARRCHFYFAQSATFQPCADTIQQDAERACNRPLLTGASPTIDPPAARRGVATVFHALFGKGKPVIITDLHLTFSVHLHDMLPWVSVLFLPGKRLKQQFLILRGAIDQPGHSLVSADARN